MIMVDDKLYNWRYGELKVTKIDGRYIHTKIIDKTGVAKDPDDNKKLSIEDEKVFVVDSLDYWIHEDVIGALLRNSNSFTIPQGQIPVAMKFPIDGNLFHKTIELEKEKCQNNVNELRKIKKEVNNELSEIQAIYDSYKSKVKKIIDDLLRLDPVPYIEGKIKSIPSDEALKSKCNSDDEYKIKIGETLINLRVLSLILESFKNNSYSIERIEDEVNKIGKSEFTNDAAYKEYTEWVHNIILSIDLEIKANEDKRKELLSSLRKIKESKELNKIIDSQKINKIGKELFKEMADCLDKEMREDKFRLETKLSEIEKNLGDYSKLDDPNYVTF